MPGEAITETDPRGYPTPIVSVWSVTVPPAHSSGFLPVKMGKMPRPFAASLIASCGSGF